MFAKPLYDVLEGSSETFTLPGRVLAQYNSVALRICFTGPPDDPKRLDSERRLQKLVESYAYYRRTSTKCSRMRAVSNHTRRHASI